MWIPKISKEDGPLYQVIADALARDVLAGVLKLGAKLPPQRQLAKQLGVDFTTITRAYSEASKRGLIEGRAGQGTYVKKVRTSASLSDRFALVDMTINYPPMFDNQALEDRMRNGLNALGGASSTETFLRYQQTDGPMEDRVAGATWLSSRIPGVSAERILICTGAQGALFSTISSLAGPNDVVLTEQLTYPGLRSIAALMNINLVPVATDEEGLIPSSFEELCGLKLPKALYLMPTLHNPTTVTLPAARRHEIVSIARKYGIPIIEDDAYGKLGPVGLPSLAAIGPEIVFHIATLSKSLSGALRIAYLVLPLGFNAMRLELSVKAAAIAGSPAAAAVARRWIQDGTAEAMLEAIRNEASARRIIAAEYLSSFDVSLDHVGYHLWLNLPHSWPRSEVVLRLRDFGISIVSSDAFALTSPVEAIRLGLGGPKSRDDLRECLHSIAELLKQPSAEFYRVV
jgi:DNA-binding transcriptional MocR family regulator